MLSIWTANLTDQNEIKKIEEAIQYSPGLDRLYEILANMKSEAERVERSKDAYDSPNWDYRQAHRNGYISCLETVIFLTNPDQRKTNDRPIPDPRTARVRSKP